MNGSPPRKETKSWTKWSKPRFNWPLTFTTNNLTKPVTRPHPNRIHDLHSRSQDHHPTKNASMWTLSKINMDKYLTPHTPFPTNYHTKRHNPCRTLNTTYTQPLTPNNLLPRAPTHNQVSTNLRFAHNKTILFSIDHSCKCLCNTAYGHYTHKYCLILYSAENHMQQPNI